MVRRCVRGAVVVDELDVGAVVVATLLFDVVYMLVGRRCRSSDNAFSMLPPANVVLEVGDAGCALITAILDVATPDAPSSFECDSCCCSNAVAMIPLRSFNF
jgi:hypothetical protein